MIQLARMASIAFSIPGLLMVDDVRSSPALSRSCDALRLVFEETFDQQPSFYHPDENPDGRWKTNFAFGVQDPRSPIAWETRTLRPNEELQYYADPITDPTAHVWRPGSLGLVARPLPPEERSVERGRLPYVSGLITTERSFQMRYGFFEARVAMPTGRGLWPAFWLLPPFRPGQPVQPPQEIDVFENIGQSDELYVTVHTDERGRKTGHSEKISVDDVTRPHAYGVLVTPENIVWYIDRREVRRTPNVDFKEPAYMLLNLAVGGTWAGAPDPDTQFPAELRIDWVRAYAVPGSQVIGSQVARRGTGENAESMPDDHLAACIAASREAAAQAE